MDSSTAPAGLTAAEITTIESDVAASGNATWVDSHGATLEVADNVLTMRDSDGTIVWTDDHAAKGHTARECAETHLQVFIAKGGIITAGPPVEPIDPMGALLVRIGLL